MFLSPLLLFSYVAVAVLAAGHNSPPSFSLHARDNSSSCISCPAVPACNCTAEEQCFVNARSCLTCTTISCSNGSSQTPSTSGPLADPTSASNGSSQTPSTSGPLAGPTSASNSIGMAPFLSTLRPRKSAEINNSGSPSSATSIQLIGSSMVLIVIPGLLLLS
ncbi:hypothetical protein K438DRAFT_602570 [Mycena galopus ATCC 62051]|nr:hypothetical protein K438DRAFT_602570 [Mycena galopus ATCC 62051]